jgi:acyl-CoA reductase-like NAD-dependent aldehyde dehydrogenase
VARFGDAVDALPFGLPWEKGVQVTPLPEHGKPETLARFVDDAVEHGAVRVNPRGGMADASFYFPQVVYPVKEGARLWHEEQFGPVVPIAAFDDLSEVLDFVSRAPYGQQASIFGRDPRVIGPLVDVLANQVCRVNLNAQCQRGPDAYPFTGRKDSAEGTLSVGDALRCFSIRSMLAAPATDGNRAILSSVLESRTSNFISTDYLF